MKDKAWYLDRKLQTDLEGTESDCKISWLIEKSSGGLVFRKEQEDIVGNKVVKQLEGNCDVQLKESHCFNINSAIVKIISYQ